jgi:hypothetical protein
MRAVVSLAVARLRHRPTRWLLIALGVAAATVLPVSAQVTSTVVSARTPPNSSAPARPSCSVLSAASCGPSTSAQRTT